MAVIPKGAKDRVSNPYKVVSHNLRISYLDCVPLSSVNSYSLIAARHKFTRDARCAKKLGFREVPWFVSRFSQ
jgi:hypothetical protein